MAPVRSQAGAEIGANAYSPPNQTIILWKTNVYNFHQIIPEILYSSTGEIYDFNLLINTRDFVINRMHFVFRIQYYKASEHCLK